MLIDAVVALMVLVAPAQAVGASAPLHFAVRVTTAPGATTALDEAALVRAVALRVRGSGIDVANADASERNDCVIAVSNEAHDAVVWLELPTGQRIDVGSVELVGRTSSDLAHTIVLLVMEALEPVFPDLGGVAPPPPVVVAPPAPPPAAPPIGVALGAWAGGTLFWPEHDLAPGGGVMLQVTRKLLVVQSDLALWAGPAQEGADYDLRLTNTNLRVAAGVGMPVGSAQVAATVGPVLRIFWIGADGVDIASPSTRVDAAVAAQVTARLPLGPVDVVVFLDALTAARAPRFVVDGNNVLTTGRFATAAGVGLLYRVSE